MQKTDQELADNLRQALDRLKQAMGECWKANLSIDWNDENLASYLRGYINFCPFIVTRNEIIPMGTAAKGGKE